MKLEFFDVAFKYAKKAFLDEEVPIGAVIVKDDKIISFGYNKKEKKSSVISHAEIEAIIAAEKKMKNWRLDDCDIYVTLDPCPMCASAIKQCRIRNVYSALSNSDFNNANIINSIFMGDKTNPSVSFFSDLDVKRSKSLLNSFFKKQRMK